MSRPAVLRQPALQIDDVNKLARTVRHSDHRLEQVWRDETHAVYKPKGHQGKKGTSSKIKEVTAGYVSTLKLKGGAQ
jgi:hypothetical protein